MTKTFAVFNANSAQAGPVAKIAAEQKFNVRAIVRDANQETNAQTPLNLQFQSTDLLEKDQVVKALSGVDAAFFHMPVPRDPSHPGIWLKNFIEAAHETKLPLLVFSTSGPAGPDFPSSPMIDGTSAVAKAIEQSGLNTITLQPAIYLENLFVPPFVPRLHTEGVLDYPPVPNAFKVPFVSHIDQAKVAVAAMQRPDLSGQYFKVASKKPIDGDELAKTVGAWLEKDVRFDPLLPNEFGMHIGDLFGSPEVGLGLAGLYKSLLAAEKSAIEVDTDALEKTFGIQLSTVTEHIESWPKPQIG
jgi:uncharacterized protein YbjT (DUF2867 family)